MHILMEKLIAFKYSCKLNHWKATKYGEHLKFDRLQEDLDDIIDDVAEKYFMAGGKTAELSPAVINSSAINTDLKAFCHDIIAYIEKNIEGQSEGIQSLLSGTAEAFTEKLAILSMD